MLSLFSDFTTLTGYVKTNVQNYCQFENSTILVEELREVCPYQHLRLSIIDAHVTLSENKTDALAVDSVITATDNENGAIESLSCVRTFRP